MFGQENCLVFLETRGRICRGLLTVSMLCALMKLGEAQFIMLWIILSEMVDGCQQAVCGK